MCAVLQYLTLYCVSVHMRADQKYLGSVFIVGKLNHSEGTLRYLLKVGSFRLCGVIAAVSELISLYVAACFGFAFSFPAVFSCSSVEFWSPSPLQGYLQPEEEEEVAGDRLWWVKRMGSHWDTVVGQDLPDTWSRCSTSLCRGEEARYWKIICEAVSK